MHARTTSIQAHEMDKGPSGTVIPFLMLFETLNYQPSQKHTQEVLIAILDFSVSTLQ